MILGGDIIVFDRRNFLFDYAWPYNFGRSQWGDSCYCCTANPTQLWFVIYRTLAMLYWWGCLIGEIVHLHQDKYFLIYLTHWGAIIEAVYLLAAWITSVVDYRRGQRYYSTRIHPRNQWDNRTSLGRKIVWILYTWTSVVAVLITVTFWAFLAPHGGVGKNSLYNVGLNANMHAVNSVLVVIDNCLVATPWRLFQFWVTMVPGVVYVIFSAIYYACGGVNEHDKHFIYPILDYGGKPKEASGTVVVLVLIAVPLVHALWYCVYLIKRAIYRRCGCGSPDPETVRGAGNGAEESSGGAMDIYAMKNSGNIRYV